MTSSLANAIKRKTHKERAQPSARKKYGLLEKHKDYVERAKDFHKKERTIKNLQRKAEERNPDEFYFAMEKSKTKDGVHVARATKQNKYKQEELRLMMTQDIRYMTLKERMDAEKIKKAQESLHYIGLPAQNKHTVFVEDTTDAKTFEPAKYFDTPAELLGRVHNRPRTEDLQSKLGVSSLGGEGAKMSKVLKKLERRKHAAYTELEQRIERHDKVANVQQRLVLQKQLMGKGRKRKLSAKELGQEGAGDDDLFDDSGSKQPAVYRWKRERQK